MNVTNETLFGTMEKTLHLLEMGFLENEVSIAIEKFGSEVPIAELADAIFTGHIAGNCTESKKFTSAASGRGSGAVPQSRNINQGESCKGKRPKEESFDDFPVSLPLVKQSIYVKNRKGKRPKQDYVDNASSLLDPAWLEEKVDPNITRIKKPRAFKSNSCKSVIKMVAKPPYFFYGNVVNLSHDCWAKISQFLYGIEPEFVNTQFFSALSRKEGYVSHPSEDTADHTGCNSAYKEVVTILGYKEAVELHVNEVREASKLCDRLVRILADSQGLPSQDQRKDILRQCQISNLIWIGPYKLSLAQPEHWEHILGYPLNRT
ncbi:hypothetical protein CRYUN_Cryun36dG0107900 [Craigia yunnanensis]